MKYFEVILIKTIKQILFIYLLLFCSTLIHSQRNIRFEVISIDQGLSHSSVFSILQDHRGFLWIGTLDGLNRYDGYNFSIYKSDPGNFKSLSHNTVFTIYETKNKSLWIGTLGGGLNKYLRERDEFVHFKHDSSNSNSLSNNNVRVLYEDKRGNLWIGTDDGLNLYNQKDNSFRVYKHDPQNPYSISNNNIWSIYEDEDRVLWIGTYGGLNKFIIEENQFIAFTHDPSDPKSISNNYIWSITQNSSNQLIIGTNNGFNIYDKKSNYFKSFNVKLNTNTSLSNSNVWRVFNDDKNNIWIGTLGGGLNIFANDNFHSYQNIQGDQNSLSNNYVWAIYQDRSGIIWIGTDIGLNKYDPGKSVFDHIKNNPSDENSLSNNEVTSILIDKDEYLWIGTRKGLNRYNTKTKIFEKYFPTDKKSIQSEYIRALYQDKEGIIWIGTNNGGLSRFDPHKNTFTNFSISDGLSNNNITAIIESNNDVLWIGTLAGLNKYDKKKNKFSYYVHDPKNPNSLCNDYVFTLLEDHNNDIWIGTREGLNLFNPELNEFYKFKTDPFDSTSLSNNFIWTLFEDSQNRIWIGTNNGLNLYHNSSNSFTYYNEKNGLANNIVYAILEDNSGNMWISTNKGLSKFNYSKNSFINFSVGDGLQSNQFSNKAAFSDKNGKLYFGGIVGVNAFYPDSIRHNYYNAPIVITDFRLFNRSVNIYEKNSPLKKIISETDNIELSYDQDVISFEFSLLDFSFPEGNTYQYKMDGFDKDWINSGSVRFATYTNLDPGDYKFRVRGHNEKDKSDFVETSITIKINPPFYKSWWFMIITSFAIVSVIFFFTYFRINQILEIERLRLKIAADLHDDIGTRLTEISMLSDILYHQNTELISEDRELIKKLGSIARTLIDNMSEIVWLINPKRDSLYELFLKLRDNYEEFLSRTNIIMYINDFKFLERIKLPMESRKNLYLIFKEAINNSIKHSGCTEISINTTLKGNILEITLYDNGKGFDINKNNKGNGLTNMQNRASSIGGEIRINSNQGTGTMVKFTGKI